MCFVVAFVTAPIVIDGLRIRTSRNAKQMLTSRPPLSNLVMKLKFPAPDENSDAYKQFADMLGDSKLQQPSPTKNASKSSSQIGADDMNESLQDIQVDSTLASELERDNAQQRTQAYTEMMELLGPPQGRFQSKALPVKNYSHALKPENNENQGPHPPLSERSHVSSPIEAAPPLKKEARTPEEEYALFESLLRSNKRSNKPRKGGRRFATRETVLEGLVTDPWETDYNLMPKKGAQSKKGSPPTKGQKPFKLPDVIEISNESIEQSYWTLEKLLDDEEADWQEEQMRLRENEEEKRQAKAAKRLLNKPPHPNDPMPSAEAIPTSSARKTSKPLSEPKNVLEPPPRRPLNQNQITAQQNVDMPTTGSSEIQSRLAADETKIEEPVYGATPHCLPPAEELELKGKRDFVAAELKTELKAPPVRRTISSNTINRHNTSEYRPSESKYLQLENPKILVTKQIHSIELLDS